MNEVLTIEDINARFPSEWVLLADVQVGEYQQVLRGKVLWHSKERSEIDRKLLELRPRRLAILYAGEPSEGMEFIL
jgi:hypothetical protein